MAPTDLESSKRLQVEKRDEDGRFMDLQPSKLRPFSPFAA